MGFFVRNDDTVLLSVLLKKNISEFGIYLRVITLCRLFLEIDRLFFFCFFSIIEIIKLFLFCSIGLRFLRNWWYVFLQYQFS